MRLSILVIIFVLQATTCTAIASSAPIRPRGGYIPAPAAKSPGRPAVIAQLRELGKQELRNAQDSVEGDCPDYTFKANVVLDTPSFFSLEMNTDWRCPDHAIHGVRTPLLFEMNTGREYEISRLYHVRDAQGALLAPLRRLVASRLDTKNFGMTPQALAETVDEDLSRGRPYLFVTKGGIWAWPERADTWLDDVLLTWADLRPYLDADEAKRINWPYH